MRKGTSSLGEAEKEREGKERFFFLQKTIKWALGKVGSKATFKDKVCSKWVWGQKGSKTFGSATSGILRRNNKHRPPA